MFINISMFIVINFTYESISFENMILKYVSGSFKQHLDTASFSLLCRGPLSRNDLNHILSQMTIIKTECKCDELPKV